MKHLLNVEFSTIDRAEWPESSFNTVELSIENRNSENYIINSINKNKLIFFINKMHESSLKNVYNICSIIENKSQKLSQLQSNFGRSKPVR